MLNATFFVAKGWLPAHHKYDGIDLEESINTICRVRGLTADMAWNMTIADIYLSIKEPEEKKIIDNNVSRLVYQYENEQLCEIRNKMTIADKIEMAEWIYQSCN